MVVEASHVPGKLKGPQGELERKGIVEGKILREEEARKVTRAEMCTVSTERKLERP